MAAALELYRSMDRLDWISDIATGRWERGFDYYVIRESDSDKVAALALRELSVGPASGTILAAAAPEGTPPPEGIHY